MTSLRLASCGSCGDPLEYADAALVINLLRDPPSTWIGHVDCAGELAYVVEFSRLVGDGLDGPNGWATHLARKRWCTPGCLGDLADAHRIALANRPAPRPAMRSVVDMIPRRPPRTPDNPRAISTGTRTRVLERDGFRCRRCGNGPDVAPLVVDHIRPVAKGGTAQFDNLQTLCRPCNAGKSDRDPTPHDFGTRA